jgi:hypothetical protein
MTSKTHLVPMANHPLGKDIKAYQINRVKNLAKQ